MVVVLVVAILLAIAVPAYLGARARSNDAAARTSLRHAFVAAKTVLSDGINVGDIARSQLESTEPSLTWNVEAPVTQSGSAAASTGPTNVAWSADEIVLVVVVTSKSGRAFYQLEYGAGSTSGVTLLRGDFESSAAVPATPMQAIAAATNSPAVIPTPTDPVPVVEDGNPVNKPKDPKDPKAPKKP